MLHKSKIIITLLLGFLLFSCAEDNNNDLQENQLKTISDSSKNAIEYCTTIADSKNPYNYVGEIHNEILNEFVLNYSGKRLSVDEIVSIVEGLANENPRFLSIKDEEAPVDPSDILRGIDDFGNNFHNIINDLRLSSRAKNDLKVLIDYLFDNAYSEREPNFDTVQGDLIRFENNALQNKDYTREERKTILSAISTARYSTCYWYNYYSSIRVADNSLAKKRKWWQWLIVAAADVGGTMAGTIATGVTASSTAYTYTNPDNK
ncbi:MULTISPECIES: hypothetical protein [Aquimarina]|uniref:hypothetical protein n=2 Tax=Flavobacteriaceae TaxID=49546 RepID=UPI000943D64A|nr:MULTISPECIES: hypothetical protein [Aquimarina]